jgi:hypothetical protein
MKPTEEMIEGMVLSFGRLHHRAQPQTNTGGKTSICHAYSIGVASP